MVNKKIQNDARQSAMKNKRKGKAQVDVSPQINDQHSYRSIFENTVIGLYRITPDGKVLLANPVFLRMLKYPSLEALATVNFEEKNSKADYKREEFKKKIKKTDEVVGLISEWTRHDGSRIYVRESARAIKDDNGKVLYYEGTVEDITELKRAEDALRESNELYRTLVNTAQEGITIVDLDGNITFANPKMADFLGYGPDKLIGRSFLDFVPSKETRRIRLQIRRHIQGKTYRYEWTLIHKDGKRCNALVAAAPLYNTEGKPYATLGIFTDITERKQVEEEFRRRGDELERKLTELSVFNEIGQALSATLKMDELMEVLLNQTKRLMYADDFFIAFYNEDVNMIEFPLYLEKGNPTNLPARSFGNGLTEYVISSKKPLLIQGEDFEKTCRRLGIKMILQGKPALSWLGVPMISHNRVLGIMSVQSTEEEHIFDDDHVRILSSIANQAATAIANARAYAKLERRLTELSVFNEVGRALGETLNLNELLEVIYKQTMRVMEGDSFYISLYDEEQNTLEFPLFVGDGKRIVMPGRPFGDGLTEYIIQQGVPIIFGEDIFEKAAELGIHLVQHGDDDIPLSWMGVPMIYHDKVVGVIAIYSKTPGIYDDDHKRLLSSIANQAAAAVLNASAYAQLENRITELSVFNEIGRALSSTIQLDELMKLLHAQTRRLMYAENFYVASFDEDTGLIEFPFYVSNGNIEQVPPRPFGDGLTEYIITHREPLLLTDDKEDSVSSINRVRFDGKKALSWLGVPLISQDKVLGVIAVQSTEKVNVYDEGDKHQLLAIANQAAGAFANAKSYTELQRRLTELSVFNELGRALGATLNFDELMEVLLTQTSRVMDTQNFYIALYNEDNSTIEIPLLVSEGKRMHLAARPFGHGLTEYVISSKNSLLLKKNALKEAEKLGIKMSIVANETPPKSWLGTPMIYQDKVVGVIGVQNTKQSNVYNESHQRLLEAIANQAGGAVLNARAYAQLKRRGQEFATLFDTSTELASTLDPNEVTSIIAQKATELIGADACTVYRFDTDTEMLVPQTTTNRKIRDKIMGCMLPLGKGITGRAAKERRPVLANNIHLDPNSFHIPGTKREPTCLLSAPLISKGELLGGMTLTRLSEEEFTEQDLQIFSLFVSQAAEAFSNSRLYGQLRKRSDEMQVLLKTNAILASTLDVDEVSRLITEKVTDLIGGDGCTIYYYDSEEEVLIPKTTTIVEDREKILAYKVKLGDGFSGKAAVERKPILQNHVYRDPKAPRIPGTSDRQACLMAVPLISRDELLGVMTLVRFSDEGFEAHDLELFTLFARQVADAAANSRLFTQLNALNENLEKIVSERTAELEEAKHQLEEVHTNFRERVQRRLASIAPVMEKISIGDFTDNIPFPEEEDEFTELIVGLNLMIDDLRFMFEENRRRSEENRRRSEELRALLETSTAISSTLEELEVADLVVQKAAEIIDADGCTVYRFDSASNELIPQTTTITENREKILSYRVPLGHGITGKAGQERRPICANNVHRTSDAPRIPGTKERPTCLLSAPLVAQGELIGVMTLSRFSENEFSDHNLELFYLFARQVAEATANSRLFGKLKELNENLEKIVAKRTKELEETSRKNAKFARELEEVIYVASHDLKTPLRAITGFSQFLHEDFSDKLGREGQLYLTRLIEAVKRMDKLLDDLLQVSAVSRTEKDYTQVPSGDLVKEAIKLIELDENTDIIYDPDELPDVFCDRAKMVELFYNIISNGIKFNTKPRKQIKVNARMIEGFHEFTIEDNGIGIEKRHYDRIFMLFQRLHQRGEYDGTGVGLPMVKRVIEEHNGRVWVESEVGVGTIFHFTIPVIQTEEGDETNLERSADG